MIDLLNQNGQLWAEYFGLAALQNTVFLGLVFVVLYLVQHASAQTKYVIGVVALFKLLLPPFVPVRYLWSTTAPLPPLSQLTATLVSSPPPVGAQTPASSPTTFDPSGAVFVLWAVCATLFVLIPIVSTLRLAVSLRDATEICDRDAAHPSLGRRVRLFKTDRIAVPLTVGIFPRKVFVPSAWDQWSPSCREAVIQHEMAHVERRDGFFHAFQILAQALYFFHPLVWFLNRRITEYREMACDDSSAGVDRSSRLEYSKNLLEVAQTVTRGSLACESVSALIRRKSKLMNRVRSQMKEGIMSPMSKRKTGLILTGLVVSVLALSWFDSGEAPAGPADPPTEKASVSKRKALVSVFIKGDDHIIVNGKEVALADFEEEMARNIDGDRSNVVTNLACTNDVPMGVLFDVQRKLVAMDLMKVNYESDIAEALPLVLPPEGIYEKIKNIPEESIATIAIDDDGTVTLDGMEINTKKIAKTVKARVTEDETTIVSIHVQEKTKYSDFVTVLAEVKKGDATRILINDPSR